MRTHGEAIRAFESSCQDTNTNFNKNPQDYHLFCIGEFDDELGSVKPLTEQHHLAQALDYAKEPDIPTIRQLIERLDKIEEAQQ